MILDLIDLHDFPSITEKHFLNGPGSMAVDPPQAPPVVIDRKAALERTMGDEQFLSELVQAFIDGLPAIKKRLEHAVHHGNGGVIAAEAGCLAGAAGNLGATELCNAAFDLEQAGRKGPLDEAPRQFRKLLWEVDRFISYARPDELDDSRHLKAS
jgi:HPt (histidine-containing phosphotransfer) domain-containing protein